MMTWTGKVAVGMEIKSMRGKYCSLLTENEFFNEWNAMNNFLYAC